MKLDLFKNYIKKYQPTPNHERLNKIVEDIIKSDIFLIPSNYIYISSFFEETLGFCKTLGF